MKVAQKTPGSRRSWWIVAALLLPLQFSLPVFAKEYVDTKKRFSLKLPRGWTLAPRPGDTTGMSFRRDLGAAFALARVSVRPRGPKETLSDSLDQEMRRFVSEIGFQKGAELPTSVGLLNGQQREFTVFANGDKRTVRSIGLYVIHAFGHVHMIQVESLEKTRKKFALDVNRLVGSYVPLAGKKDYAPLISSWENPEGGPSLNLSEDNRFEMGPLRGHYIADGGRITLIVPEGQEYFRYKVDVRSLTLDKAGDITLYQRRGAPRFVSDEGTKTTATKLTKSDLVGRWRALDAPSTEPLVLHLAPSGSISFGPLAGRWRYRAVLLTVRSVAGETVTYTVSKSRGKLLLGGGDLEKDLLFAPE